MTSGERAKLRHEMRIGQEAYIEHQVGVVGNAMLKTEADAGGQNVSALLLFVKQLDDVAAQFVNVELRRIDDQVGQAPNVAQMAAFGRERRLNGRIDAERM